MAQHTSLAFSVAPGPSSSHPDTTSGGRYVEQYLAARNNNLYDQTYQYAKDYWPALVENHRQKHQAEVDQHWQGIMDCLRTFRSEKDGILSGLADAGDLHEIHCNSIRASIENVNLVIPAGGLLVGPNLASQRSDVTPLSPRSESAMFVDEEPRPDWSAPTPAAHKEITYAALSMSPRPSPPTVIADKNPTARGKRPREESLVTPTNPPSIKRAKPVPITPAAPRRIALSSLSQPGGGERQRKPPAAKTQAPLPPPPNPLSTLTSTDVIGFDWIVEWPRSGATITGASGRPVSKGFYAIRCGERGESALTFTRGDPLDPNSEAFAHFNDMDACCHANHRRYEKPEDLVQNFGYRILDIRPEDVERNNADLAEKWTRRGGAAGGSPKSKSQASFRMRRTGGAAAAAAVNRPLARRPTADMASSSGVGAASGSSSHLGRS